MAGANEEVEGLVRQTEVILDSVLAAKLRTLQQQQEDIYKEIIEV